jgi:hypothetical protein
MQLFDFHDLTKKNRDVEASYQKKHAENNDLLWEISEEKKEKFTAMREDINAVADFLNEVERNSTYEFDMSSLNVSKKIGDVTYIFKTLSVSTIAGKAKSPMTLFVFENKNSSKDQQRIHVDDIDHYSGTSLSDDAKLLDSVLLKWDDIRKDFSGMARKYGEDIIGKKQKKMEDESAKIDDVNHEWIEKLKKKKESAA